jgi:hypothetical protein
VKLAAEFAVALGDVPQSLSILEHERITNKFLELERKTADTLLSISEGTIIMAIHNLYSAMRDTPPTFVPALNDLLQKSVRAKNPTFFDYKENLRVLIQNTEISNMQFSANASIASIRQFRPNNDMRYQTQPRTAPNGHSQRQYIGKCHSCGDNHPRKECWVFKQGIQCNGCGKKGHLIKVCRNKQQPQDYDNTRDQIRQETPRKPSPHPRRNSNTNDTDLPKSAVRFGKIGIMQTSDGDDIPADHLMIDPGAMYNVCPDLDLLSDIRNSNVGCIVADGSRVPTKFMGTLKIDIFDTEGNRFNITAHDVIHLPGGKHILINSRKIKGMHLDLPDNSPPTLKYKSNIIEIIDVNDTIWTRFEQGHRNAPEITTQQHHHFVFSAFTTSGTVYALEKNADDTNDNTSSSSYAVRSIPFKQTLNDLHKTWGHLPPQTLKRMMQDGTINCPAEIFQEEIKCVECITETMIRNPHTGAIDYTTLSIGDLVYADVKGPLPKSNSGENYYIILIDAASRFVLTTPFTNRSTISHPMLRLFNDFKLTTGRQIQTLHLDGAPEFTSKHFTSLAAEQKMVLRINPGHSPHRNGMAERTIRTLSDMINPTLQNLNGKIDNFKNYWPAALRESTIILNFTTPSKKKISRYNAAAKEGFSTSQFIHYARKYLGHFGHYAIVKTLVGRKKSEMDPAGQLSVCLGFNPKFESWEFIRLSSQRVIHSTEAIFIDDDTKLKLPLDDGNKLQVHIYPDVHTKTQTETGPPPIQDDLTLQTSNDILASHIPASPPTSPEGHDTLPLPSEPTLNDDLPPSPPRPTTSTTQLYSTISAQKLTLKRVQNSPDRSKWDEAMTKELNTLSKMSVFDFVPSTAPPQNAKFIPLMWSFRVKENGDFKARLCICGHLQKDFDPDDCYAPQGRIDFLRIFIYLSLKLNFKIHHFDAVAAYCNAAFPEPYFSKEIPGFNIPSNHCVRILGALYGAHESGALWAKLRDDFLLSIGFSKSIIEASLYHTFRNETIIFLLLCTDDFLVSSTPTNILWFKDQLFNRFQCKDEGVVKLFNGITFNCEPNSISLSQKNAITALANDLNLTETRTIHIPFDMNQLKLIQRSSDEDEFECPFRSTIGSVLYITRGTRPDIAYHISLLAHYSSRPTKTAWHYLQNVVRYLYQTRDLCLHIKVDPMIPLEDSLTISSDASHAQESERRSRYGIALLAEGTCLFATTKKIDSPSISSTEAEYIALSEASCIALWIRNILGEFNIQFDAPFSIIGDSKPAIAAVKKISVLSTRLRHIDTRYHLIRDYYESKKVSLTWVDTGHCTADILTKPNDFPKLSRHRKAFGIF